MTADERRAIRYQALQKVMQGTEATIVVGIFPEGSLFAARSGVDPEDSRNAIIASANHARNELSKQAHRGGER